MKKIRLNTLVSRKFAIASASTLLALSAATTYAVINTSEPIKKHTPEAVHAVSKQESVPEPKEDTPDVPAAAPVEPATPAKPVVVPKAVVHIKTNDELIAEYGWQNLKGTVDLIAQELPDLFNDTNRESSFKYIYDVGTAYMVKLNVSPTQNKTDTLYNFYYSLLGYNPNNLTMAKWIEVGNKVGVSTSRYK